MVMKMKKIIPLTILFFISLNIIPDISFAEETNLIQNVQIGLKEAENPKRLEVIFDLTEPINLSQGSSDIIYEYFTQDTNGNLEIMQYKKGKSWSGYLNSYDNYPAGEQKYSSGGSENGAYSDNVPATKIYTSTKTGTSIDVMSVVAVRITVFRENGSGEKVTAYSDGAAPVIEKIDIPVSDEELDTGITLESNTTELPANTVLIANKLTSGSIYENVTINLADVKDFIVYEIKLESDGVEIQPNGKVKISIPIPESFDSSNLTVYRFDDDGTKTPYSVTVTVKDGAKYAIFETVHFSTYVLVNAAAKIADEAAGINTATGVEADTAAGMTADTATDIKADAATEIDNAAAKTAEPEVTAKEAAEKDETPKTGTTQAIYYYIIVMTIISAIGIVAFYKKQQ